MALPHSIISGKVLDSKRNAISGARVFFSAGPGALPDIAALTNEAGEFSLPAPIQGAYTIEFAADGFRETQVTLTIPGEPTSGLTVQLEPVK